MKLSKKFIEDLHKIGEDAFIEKNQWIGKLVPEIIIDNLQKRGISQEDIEGCVMLSVKAAKILENFCWRYAALLSTEESTVHNKLFEQIKKVEECNETK